MKTYLFLFLSFFLCSLSAQKPTEIDCEALISEGEQFAADKEYTKASNKYVAALICNPTNPKVAQALKMVQDSIEAQKKQIATTLALVEAEKEKNEKIIDAMYFYEGRFGLTYKDNKYGFMNKEAEEVITEKYDYAEPFDNETGFAKVKNKDATLYSLLDTLGNTYRLATNVKEIASYIEAIDFRETYLDTFPMEIIRKCPKLKILLLSNNSFKTIPDSLNELKELIYLDLGNNNKFKSFPTKLNLPQLRTLDLRGNFLNTWGENAANFPQLQKLVLSWNSGADGLKLHDEIGKLTNLKILYLNHCGIKQLPSSISNLKGLKKLWLASNQLHNIMFLTHLDALQNVDISYNVGIKTIPAAIKSLKQLLVLDASNCRISADSIASEFGELSQLKYLYLSDNPLGRFPESIYHLQQLNKLYLDNCKMKGIIQKEIGTLKTLKLLDLEGNRITYLPIELRELKQLKSLNLSKNPLGGFPEPLFSMQQLNELNLSNCNIKGDLPAEIGQLSKLNMLNLRKNQLISISPNIAKLSTLNALYLQDNLIKVLPAEMAGLLRLKYLDFDWGKIDSLPNLPFWKSLKELTLNRISKLPKGMAYLKNLETLDLSSTHLHTLPIEILDLPSLKQLILSDNDSLNFDNVCQVLSRLPQKIALVKNGYNSYFGKDTLIVQYSQVIKPLSSKIVVIKNLICLVLLANGLDSLPKEIGELKQLKYLYLGQNSLHFLPKEIENLQNLEVLDISNNLFDSIPKEIKALPKLKYVGIWRNPLHYIPKDFEEQYSEAVIPFYADCLNYFIDNQYYQQDFIEKSPQKLTTAQAQCETAIRLAIANDYKELGLILNALFVRKPELAVKYGEWFYQKELAHQGWLVNKELLGHAYMLTGDITKAKEWYRKYLANGDIQKEVLIGENRDWQKLEQAYYFSPTQLAYIAEMRKWLKETYP